MDRERWKRAVSRGRGACCAASAPAARLARVVLAIALGGACLLAQGLESGPPTPPPTPPAGAPGIPLAPGPTALQLQVVSPAQLPAIGVVDAPELAELLRKAGYDARVVSYQDVDAGALDAYGTLLVNLERPLTLTAAAFLRDFVQRGGRMIACSWGTTVSPKRQLAFPAYRLQETLQVRINGWSAAGNAYLRSVNSGAAFRGLPEYVEVRSRSTPLVEALPGGKVEASWVAEDGTPSGRSAARSPALVTTACTAYFAPDILSEALLTRNMLRLLENAIRMLSPVAAPDPRRLALAELEVALGEARRVAAASTDANAAALLAAAEARASAAAASTSLPPAGSPVPAAAAPAALAAPPIAAAPAPGSAGGGAQTDPGALAPGGDPLAPGLAPDATGLEIAPAVPPDTPAAALSPTATAAIAAALDAAERIGLLAFPSRPVEARAVLLPRSLLPASRAAIGQLLSNLQAAGINLVVPEVYCGGLTLAPGPNQDPRFAGHDPLASILAEAAARGMSVYAWVPLLTTGAPGATSPFAPGWSAQTRAGARYVSSGLQWLCPSQAGARDALCAGVRRVLASYPVQGILLDCLDYGGVPEACYDPTCVALFQADTGRNPRTETLRGEWEAEWLRWRRERVSTLVRRLTRDLRTVRPGVPILAGISAVGIEPRSYAIADWRSWVRQSWVDGICPELDSGDTAAARKLSQRVQLLAPGTRVLPVVSTARVRTSRHAMRLVTAAQEGNAAGVVFDLPSPLVHRWGVFLARGSFRQPARLPW
ncbi:MAG: family 10 glycosylhydrolase [Armatimonadetes bacterium]|nr:family 10 glycosylhydrolase [Armatimonadota bacterium]